MPRRLVRAAAVAAAALAGGLLAPVGQAVADTSPPAGTPQTVSADALPTVQINGVVWSQTTVGNTVYATGNFSQSRPAGAAAGTNQTARSNLLAYNITTGNLVTGFNHPLNGQGLFITRSPNGSRVYVGGQFTTVDGQAHSRIAAFDTATGALVASFSPTLNATVRAIAATDTTVYVGGDFSTANGQSRRYLAALAASNGALLSWAPTLDSGVTAMTMAPDNSRVIVGGRFTTINGSPLVGIGPVDATSGATTAWTSNFPIQDSGPNAAMTQLVADGSQVYGTAYQFTTGGNFEGRFAVNPYTGVLAWLNSCHGDSYGTFPIGSVLYSAGHSHDCSDDEDYSQDVNNVFNARHNFVMAETTGATGIARQVVFAGGNGVPGPVYASFAGQPHGGQLDWYPTMSEGTFTGQSQAAWSVTGNAGYVAYGGEFPRVNGGAQQGLVRFALRGTAPNAVGPVASTDLTPRAVSLSSGTLRVAWRVTNDPDNETLTYRLYRDSGTTPISTQTINSRFWYQPTAGYVDTVSAGSAHTYRVTATDPLGNVRMSGTSTAATAGTATLSQYATTVRADGATNFWPLSETSGTVGNDGAGYNDLTLGSAVTRGAPGPTPGGAATATSFDGTAGSTTGSRGNGERLSTFSVEAWVRTTSTAGGEIVGYGLFPSSNSVNVDRTLYLAPDGRAFFGVWSNNTNNTVNSATPINNGQWHHLVGTVSAGAGMHLYVDGVDVASRSGVTSTSVLAGYWRVGGDNLNGWNSVPNSVGGPPGGPGQPPTPAAPFALNGSIADVAVYPTALTQARVQAHFGGAGGGANQTPTAAFTSSCTNLTCAVDGIGSSDPDGSIATYAWTFGDGATATGPSPTHAYAAAGSFPIGLTVTDNQGATATITHPVTVTAAPATTLATDAFNRTATGGWGTADQGGAWTISSGASNFSVTPGAGSVRMATAGAGSGTAYLAQVSARDVDMTGTVAVDKLATGNGTTIYVVARRTSSTSQYRAKIRIAPSGAVLLSITKLDGSATEAVVSAETTVAGLTYVPGSKLRFRLEAVGAGPTTLQARVWADGSAEPTTWQRTGTDSGGAALQAAGNPGLSTYISSGVTNTPVTVSFGAYTVAPPL